MKTFIPMVSLVAGLAGAAHAQDAYQWLEPPQDARALTWAMEETKVSQAQIAAMPERADIEAELKRLLAAAEPPPQYQLYGPIMLRFQRSVAHPHGVLSVARRGANGAPGAWRAVLDVDVLRKAEGKAYELQFGATSIQCVGPDFERCILRLSPQGGDEVELREFDLKAGVFVKDGFRTPASRSFVAWLDKDRLLIEHTVGDAPALPTGWPASVAIWTRGAPLSAAKVVYRAQPTDALMSIGATGDGPSRVGVIVRALDYSTMEHLVVRPDGAVEPTSVPRKIKMGLGAFAGGRVFAQLGEPASVNGKTLPAESVVAYDLRAEIPVDRRLSLVYTPAEGDFIADPYGGMAPGQSQLRMIVSRRGVQRIVTAKPSGEGWTVQDNPPEPVGVAISFVAVDPSSDAAIAQRGGYITPNRLDLITGAIAQGTTLFSEPSAIDPQRLVVELKTAKSKDGTEIDYYLVRPKTPGKPGATPVLMTGYGAFGITLSPDYLGPTVGGKAMALWLNRGGALVMPMIRGGGERGEAWHQAAIREKRQNSYDDFAAVTEDLIASGLTSPRHIGVFGSSNGGLLAAVMGVQRPDLYGAIVSDVPLTDLVRMPFMGMGAAWTNEYGDAKDPTLRAAIERYSPYQNIVAGRRYPPFLVSVATSDNRVGPGHARKLAAKLKAAGSPVYYLEDQEGGHGVSDPLSRPELMADRMTFLINALR
ncbi:prolyl oligopeptidase family serine peptidase [uncultured Caulobacter sp.]|uniref:prolyl oligopeptidase family serine peptidase n=1 Tax=uncultured Caulobacter sp. TaxID=158749 RepID=UPI0026020A63|nr:prolyl oligopeptidase family serine peptidase [uncultured Caulobacter sp.]